MADVTGDYLTSGSAADVPLHLREVDLQEGVGALPGVRAGRRYQQPRPRHTYDDLFKANL